jgi:hypothetical protein
MLVLAAPVFAQDPPADDAPADQGDEAEGKNGCGWKNGEKKPMRHDLTGEIYVQGLQNGGAALGGAIDLVQGWGFLKLDARGESYQHWIGRGTIGLDAFPRSRFDLTFGVFAGSVGHVVDVNDDGIAETSWRFAPTIGTEFGIGTGLGPVTVRWEHAEGGGDQRFSEGTLRLGFDIVKNKFNTFGQVVYFDPDEEEGASGFGIGAALRI